MLESLALALLNALTSTCVKFYLTALSTGGGIDYKKAELGYAVPNWYMNPRSGEESFVGYGTSTVGDEFESIDDAKEKAVRQMVETMRLSSRSLVKDKVRYDATSMRQQRMVDLFVRAEGLEEFVRLNAVLDEKKLVEVTKPQRDMRAFVRIKLDPRMYLSFQEERVKLLKTRILQQKTEDLMAEIASEGAVSSNAPPAEAGPPQAVQPPAPEGGTNVGARAGGRFGALERELDAQTK
jgi:hypothetical protein